MEKFRVQEKGEIKILNLDQVTHVAVHENSIGFQFVTGNTLTFTELQVGPGEFNRIRDSWIK
jgi:hypothetical protein